MTQSKKQDQRKALQGTYSKRKNAMNITRLKKVLQWIKGAGKLKTRM